MSILNPHRLYMYIYIYTSYIYDIYIYTIIHILYIYGKTASEESSLDFQPKYTVGRLVIPAAFAVRLL